MTRLAPLSRSLKASLEKSAETYHAQLDDQVMEYLAGRGLSAQSSATHRLGVVRDPLKGEERFAGRLAIPYIGPKGNVYGMNYRCLEDHDCKELGHGKYEKPTGLPTRMFNTRALMAPTDYIFVTEGEVDCISVTEMGWPAVGLAGASTWGKHYARMLAGFSKVVLLADADEAGDKLAGNFQRSLPTSGRVILSRYGDARDFNSILSTYGRDGVIALLKEEEA